MTSTFFVAGVITRVVLGLAILMPAAILVVRKRRGHRRMRTAATYDELLGLALKDRGLNAFMQRVAAVRNEDPKARHHHVSAAMLRHLRGPHPLLWVLAFVYAAWSVFAGIGGGGIRVGLEAVRGFEAVATVPPEMKSEMIAATVEAMAGPLQGGLVLALIGVVLSALTFTLLEAASPRSDRDAVLGVLEHLEVLDYPTEARRLNVWGRRLRPLGWLGSVLLMLGLGAAIPRASSLPLADGTFYFTEHPTPSSNAVTLRSGAQLSLAESTARGTPVDALDVTVAADWISIDDTPVMETARLPVPAKVAWSRRATEYPSALVPEPVNQRLAEGREHQERVRSFDPDLPVLTTVGLLVDATRPFREVSPVLVGCFNHGYLEVQAITRVRDARNLAGFVTMKLAAPEALISERDKKTECDPATSFWVDEQTSWQTIIDAVSTAGKPVSLVPVARGTRGAPALAERCYTIIEND